MKKQYFKQLLLTSITQLLIAFAILSLILNIFVVSFIEDEIKEGDKKLVELIQKSVDRQLYSIDRITKALVYNPTFTPYVLLENPYKALEARQILKTVAVANPLMETIGTSYYFDDYLITDETSALKPRFFNSLGFDTHDMESSETLERGYIINEDYLVFLVSMNHGLHRTSGYFFYVFDKRILSQGLFPETNEINQTRYVSLSSADGEKLVDNIPKTGFKPNDYILSEFISPSTGLIYSIYSSNQDFHTFLNQLFLLFFISITAAIFTGGILVLLFSRINYAPVRHLSAILNPSIICNDDSTMGEFEQIEKTLVSFMAFSENPSALHEVDIRSRRDNIARGCINGIYRSRESLIQELDSAEIKSPHSFYCFVRILVTKSTNDLTLSANYSSEKGHLSCMNTQIDRNQILYLLNCPNDKAGKELLDLFKFDQEKKGDSILTIGVGELHDQPELLAQSFLEATTALEYRLVRGVGQIIQYKSIPKPDKINLAHVKILQQQIRQAMLSANRDSMKEAVDRTIQLSSDLSLSGARYVYWNFIRVIRETMDSYSLSHDEKLLLDELNVSHLTNFETLNELSFFITTWIDSISFLVENRTPDKNEAICRRVKDYIMENCTNPQLSLADISHFTGLSQGHLCRIFKETESKTILQFIKDIRYDMSCTFLQESDLSITEIVVQLGYSDAASFIREFKKRYAITPGKYREQFFEIGKMAGVH